MLWLPNVLSSGLLFIVSIPFCLLVSHFFAGFKKASIAYLLGLLLVVTAANTQKQQQISQNDYRTVDAFITDLPLVSPQKVSFTIKTRHSNQRFLISHYRGYQNSTPPKQLPNYQPGDYYRFELSLKPPHGTANGTGFDRERWLFRHGIDGVGSIRHAQAIEPYKISLSQAINSKINHWRYQISQLLDNNFTNTRTNALLHALSIGDKSRLESGDYNLLHISGTAHLIAISGLHIGMVAAIGAALGWLVFALFPQQRLPRPLIQVMMGLTLAFIYAGLAGFSVSTQRALIMLAVYGWFKWRRRSAYAWDVWSISLLLVLLIDPLNILDAGFWLSFWAVAVLILAFQGRPAKSSQLIDFIKIQWLLLIGMMPLSLLQFGNLKIWAPLVNLMVIPIMTFLYIPVLLLTLLVAGLSGHIPDFLVSYLSFISELFWRFLDHFSHLDKVAWGWPVNEFWSFALLTLAAVILLLPKAVPQRHWALLLIAIALWPATKHLSAGQFRAEFFDVGQGTSVLISTQNHHLLYDVGARFPSGFNIADAVVLPMLQQLRINQLDVVILSHDDNDHAGAYPYLAQGINIEQVLSTDGQHKDCIVGQQWQWDNVNFEVLSPYNLYPNFKNDSSCVLKVSTPTTSLLLTGDIEQAVEYRLTQHHTKDIGADILLIPHHGSNTSSTPEFVATVNPKIAINSSGAYNQFKHPTEQVKAVYDDLNIPMVDTQNSGRITLTTSHDSTDKFQIERFRHQNPRFWRR